MECALTWPPRVRFPVCGLCPWASLALLLDRTSVAVCDKSMDPVRFRDAGVCRALCAEDAAAEEGSKLSVVDLRQDTRA